MNFPVFSCTCVWGCSWKKIQKEEEENEEEESLFRWCVESDGALISPHRGPTLPNSEFDWKMRGKRIKESKNKREKNEQSERFIGRARSARRNRRRKRKKDEDGSAFFPLFGSWRSSSLSVGEMSVPLQPPFSLFFSSLWNLILF
jgi:hypothetical protein